MISLSAILSLWLVAGVSEVSAGLSGSGAPADEARLSSHAEVGRQASAPEGPSVAVDQSGCLFEPSHPRGRDVWRERSRTSELVAPSPRSRTRQAAPAIPWTSFVDAEIFGKMERDGIAPAPLSSDDEFLRRVSLDLTGQIPSPDARTAFLADRKAGRRERLVDQLLYSEGFVERWTLWFGDHVQNVQTTAAMGREGPTGRNAYHAWIRDSLRMGKGYDAMARELVTGSGDAFLSGPPNYWVRQMQPNGPIQDTYDNLASHTAERFLGLRLECLSCHSGPGHLDLLNVSLSTYSRTDFWKTAAFFARTQTTAETDAATQQRKYLVSDNTTGAYRLNTTSGNKTPRQAAAGQPPTVAPAFFLTGEGPRPADKTWRAAYARMLTAHPQFARAAVNYVWKELFGLGLVEPADNHDLLRQDPASTPEGLAVQPTHPALLDGLAAHFVASGYDLRELLRLLTTSSAYQLSMRYPAGGWNESWAPYFARRLARRLPAEMLVDAVLSATGVGPGANFTATGIGPVRRAILLPDPTEGTRDAGLGRLLSDFGRGNRDTTPRSNDGSILQALDMLNSPGVTNRVLQQVPKDTSAAGDKSLVARTLEASSDPETIARTLFVATLGRPPSGAETATAVAHLRSGTLARKAEDLHLVLLNTLEFLHY